ncbi:S8 family serine peptidase [Flavobacterium sp.]|uniref:S8 family serine peptidase n=1 Tax=Flavobacterium sp. TaxID=239 RepID=UPI002B4B1822|nr:S8 family serine peptidase [Flavobacterium sp.]HLF51026.1 S8 family serine peptidase [Flavobacterium sp.]
MIKYTYIFIIFFCFNCFGQSKQDYIKNPTTTYRNELPINIRAQWQHLDIEKDTLAGTSLNRAYKEIIKNKKGKEIIVAVIDTDIDINHEDLKPAIWINKKEIPHNGIDDDKNGYTDDVNGWNFLGNAKGESISYANITPIRILRNLKKKYSHYPNFEGNIKDSLLYVKTKNQFKKDLEDLNELKKYASQNLKSYRESFKKVEAQLHKNNFEIDEIDNLYRKCKKENASLTQEVLTLRNFIRLGKDYTELINDSIKVQDKFRTSYNEDYHDRAIIGDNDLDLKDTHYGNNNVSKNAKWTYHGTIVSGVIGANRKNKIGIEGFSDQIKIMPILAVPYGGYEHEKDINLAIHYAVDNGAKVINMSFGNTSGDHTDWIKEAFLYAQEHDVLLIAGAGNDSSDNDIKPFYPIDYDEQTGVEFCDNFIKVGAITLDGDKYFLAHFTNYGKKTVDLFAPGYFLKTTDPIVGYSYRDGTSMAGPIVTGVAALIRSHYPKLTAKQVKNIILESGVAYKLDVVVPGEKNGLLKPFTELSKSGKVVNAYNALLLAEEISTGKKN